MKDAPEFMEDTVQSVDLSLAVQENVSVFPLLCNPECRHGLLLHRGKYTKSSIGFYKSTDNMTHQHPAVITISGVFALCKMINIPRLCIDACFSGSSTCVGGTSDFDQGTMAL